MNGLTRLVLGRIAPTESGCRHSSTRLLTLERESSRGEREREVYPERLGLRKSSANRKMSSCCFSTDVTVGFFF